MSLTQALDGFQRRRPAAGFPLAVIYKYFDDQGPYLAALMAYYGFLSLFPLLLLLTTALGILLRDNVELQQQVLQSAARQIPVLGDDLVSSPRSLPGGKALVIGVLGALYGGIGVAQAAQNAMNVLWSVPRNSRPNPIKGRLRSLVAVLVLGLGFVLTTVLSGLFSGGGAFGAELGHAARAVAITVAVLGNAWLFVLAFRYLPAHRIPVRHVVPGALAAAVTWQALQAVGTYYVGHSLKHASQVYGLFGLVLGLLGWLYLAALLTVLCAEINVVRSRRLWPRALLTPFTDAVELTRADERTYAATAAAQRNKGFEQIDVTFDKDRPAD